ncbi:flippase [Chitinophaga sp. Cy-1792]|uniref:flippase n=1 Tax=Chitinophaga sp. Cy-1792 TaxID=2608339 RepID=UPI0014243799|nr:flippase [Chitinophaga sp. Cy-1792]NIG54441.1 flippase [Chitinophaga sp. Cy-1792]
MHKLVENTGWLLADKISRLFPGILVLALLARHLGPGTFGIWSYTIAVSAIMGSIAILGMDKLIIKELMAEQDTRTTVTTILFIRITAAMLCMILSIVLVYLMNPNPVYLLCICFSSTTILFQSFDVMDGYYQVSKSLKTVIVPKVTMFLTFSACRLIAVFLNAGLVVFLALAALELACAYSWILYRYLRHTTLHPRFINFKMAGKLLRDSWVLILGGLVVVLFMKVDNVLLNFLSTPAELGNYVVAIRISELWYALPTVISTAMLPILFKKKSEGQTVYLRTLEKWLRASGVISTILALGISITARPLLFWLYGSAYVNAGAILQIHIWAVIPVFLMMVLVQYLFVESRYKLYLYGNVAGLIVNIILNIILIPTIGGKGAAIATVAAYSTVFITTVLLDSSRQAILLSWKMLYPARIYADAAEGLTLLRRRFSKQLFLHPNNPLADE